MRLQELFLTETTSEDRALVSLSASIYAKFAQYKDVDLGDADFTDPDQQIITIGKIGELFDTSITALNDVTVEIQGGDPFNIRSNDVPDDDQMATNSTCLAFWEEDTATVVFSLECLSWIKMRTTVTHELRHALDYFKANKYPNDAKGYFTPRKKEHRKIYRNAVGEIDPADDRNRLPYLAQPAEINARFAEVLDVLSKRIPQWYNKLQPDQIRPQLIKDLNNLISKYRIAELFPERTQSRSFKRLLKRAYDFIQKETSHIESLPGTATKATGNW